MSAATRQSTEDVPQGVHLYVIQGSHACHAAMLMLAHKQIPFRTVTLPTGAHPMLLRVLRFPGNRKPIRSVDGGAPAPLALLDRMGTVPALRARRERVQTNRAIARWLDRVRPQPPLFPADRDQRQAVEAAEDWGYEEFQMLARRILLATAMHGLDAVRHRGGDGRLGPLLDKHEPMRRIGSQLAGRVVFKADGPEAERRLLDQLPAKLDRIDAWIAEGVLGGAEPNAADFLIVPSLALLCYRPSLREQIEARPAGALMQRLMPEPVPG